MNDKLEKTILDIKTPGLNSPESSVLTDNRFDTYLVLIFSNLNKAQIYKMPYRDSTHHEIEVVMSFNSLNLFELNKDTEDYHKRGPNDKSFLFEIEDKRYIYVGEKLITFETNDKIVESSSEESFSDLKYQLAHGKENIYFLLHQKYISIDEYKNSTQKDEYKYLYKEEVELKGDNIGNEGVVENGNDFIKCKIIHHKNST